MSYSKKMLYIVQKLDAVHGAIENIREQKCATDTAAQLSSFLVERLENERKRLVQELEQIAHKKSFRAVENAGLPVQPRRRTAPRHYTVRSSRPVFSSMALH